MTNLDAPTQEKLCSGDEVPGVHATRTMKAEADRRSASHPVRGKECARPKLRRNSSRS